MGGTVEARQLAERLCADPRLHIISSLAGRTNQPASLPGEVRVGGFGGIEGLVGFLRERKIALLVDATHPFATQISENAFEAAMNAEVDRITLLRPPWRQNENCRWKEFENLEAVIGALPRGASAFLALGSQYVSAFSRCGGIEFIIRMADEPVKPPFASCTVVTGLPSNEIEKEQALLAEHGITHLVCRNSGGNTGFAKVEAACNLGIKVLMISRPTYSVREPLVETVESVVRFIGDAFPRRQPMDLP